MIDFCVNMHYVLCEAYVTLCKYDIFCVNVQVLCDALVLNFDHAKIAM